MRFKSLFIFLSLFIMLSLFIPATRLSAAVFNFRQAVYPVKAEVSDCPDTPNHTLGIMSYKGIAFFDPQDVASVTASQTIDYINGSGPHLGYFTYTFSDNSTLSIKITGTTKASQGGVTVEGKATVIKGTGRFSSTKGSGTYTGKRPPKETDTELYHFFKLDITLK